MLPETNNETALICMNLFKAGVSPSELDKELAYVAIQEDHGFNNLVPQRIPQAPFSLDVFKKMTDEEKKQFLFRNPDYFKGGDGGIYLDIKDKAETQTLSNKLWLIKIRKIFQDIGDEASFKKVDDRLVMFR